MIVALEKMNCILCSNLFSYYLHRCFSLSMGIHLAVVVVVLVLVVAGHHSL